jgi:hypothetical protein
MLKKCEFKHLYTGVNKISVLGERIFVADLADSFHLVKHKTKDN